MTFREPPAAPRTGRDVWTPPSPIGYLESIQAAGAFAAPLLAAASFTLAALLLQASVPFARWPDLALLFFTSAGLAQIFAVQCVVWTRRHMTTPEELRQWYPDDYEQDRDRPTPWLHNVQWSDNQRAHTWARRTRGWLNTGIALLLAGVAISLVPRGPVGAVRWVVIAVAGSGVLVEAAWVADTVVQGFSRRLQLLAGLAAAGVSGAATAVAAASAASHSVKVPAIAWWVLPFAAAVAAAELLRLADVRFCRGRLRAQDPPAGPRFRALAAALTLISLAAIAAVCVAAASWRTSAGAEARDAAIALLAVIFASDAATVTYLLLRERAERLYAAHPGVAKLLPARVTIGAHHRALARCAAYPAAEDDLSFLLEESRPVLGDNQPTPDLLSERLRRSPDCVIAVDDRCPPYGLVGYFIIYPLTEHAVRRIQRKQIASAAEFKAADLTASGQGSAASYVSVIWATGPAHMRRSVIAALVEYLAGMHGDGLARPVFARPVTAKGRALLEQYGFRAPGGHPPAGDEGRPAIWELRASGVGLGGAQGTQ